MTSRNHADSDKGFFIAMKGGNNAESHNHNDVGSFIVYADAEPLLIDPGVGEYTSATFSANRYKIWTMQSAYHNLPQINGVDQHEGKDYHAVNVEYQPKSLTMDIASAYPKQAEVKSWKRKVSLKKGDFIEITEDYQLSEWKQPQRMMLLTPIKPNVAQRDILQLGKHQLHYPHRQISVTIEDISNQMDALLRGVWGRHLYRIVMTCNDKQLNNKIKYSLK